MKFKIETCDNFYMEDDIRTKKLQELGFVFEDYEIINGKKQFYKDRDINCNLYVDINTIDELIEFIKKYSDSDGMAIININNISLKLYDGYNE